jgi:DNA-binding transcriptional MerR regulator
MQPKELAKKLDVTSNTIRRWCDQFHPFLSPLASPPRGKARVFSDLDVRILTYIGVSRDAGQPLELIEMRLKAMQDNDWRDLPDVPWSEPEETIPVPAAAARAEGMVTVALLQRDLEDTRQRLEKSEQRVLELENQIDALQASQTATEAEKAEMRLELERARGDVATLQARLSAYAITGGDKPIPVALIIAVTALVAVLIVALVFVLARVLL